MGLITSGKTKELYSTNKSGVLRMLSLDKLSADDGAIQSKLSIAAYKNKQNALIMKYLQKHGIDTAFIEQISDTETLVRELQMLGIEFVVRGYPYGTYLLRNPAFIGSFDERGLAVLSGTCKDNDGKPMPFAQPQFEMFHKNTFLEADKDVVAVIDGKDTHKFLRDGVWEKGVHTDPYIDVEKGGDYWGIYNKKKPIIPQYKVATMAATTSKQELKQVKDMSLESFNILKNGLEKIDVNGKPVKLAGTQFEFGKDQNGNIKLGDVVDNDTLRLWVGGDPAHALDKQSVYSGQSDDMVVKKYAQVTELLERL